MNGLNNNLPGQGDLNYSRHVSGLPSHIAELLAEEQDAAAANELTDDLATYKAMEDELQAVIEKHQKQLHLDLEDSYIGASVSNAIFEMVERRKGAAA